MKNIISILALAFMCLNLIACGEEGASNSVTTQDPSPDSYYDQEECDRLDLYGIGIKGNRACPYQGDYDPQAGYQQASISYESEFRFRVGLGYRIDFGWDNDWQAECPGPGQIPVFVNGRFNHCVNSNPSYSSPYDGSNTSTCAGSNYNPTVTNCTPSGVTPTGNGVVRYTD